jgi:hypothetical protein
VKWRHSIAALGLILLVLVALEVGRPRPSGAVFSSASDSTVRATTDRIQSWLHVYSQSTDPDGLTGYATRRGSSPLVPAATGQDETVAVHLGGFSSGFTTYSVNRVVTIKAVPTFPVVGVTQVSAQAYLIADPETGRQPIRSIGFAAIGSTQRINPITVNAGEKYQMNLRVRMQGMTWDTLYEPRVQIVVTYAGFTVTYYRYEFVVKAYYGNGPGPD